MAPLTEAQSEKIAEGFSGAPGGAIQERQVKRAFGRHFARRNPVQISQAAGHVSEAEPAGVHPGAKGQHPRRGFRISPGGGGFS